MRLTHEGICSKCGVPSDSAPPYFCYLCGKWGYHASENCEKHTTKPINVQPPISACCFAPLTVEGKGATHWYACSKCKQPADPTPQYFCSWCGQYGDHASANCEKLKGKIANAS